MLPTAVLTWSRPVACSRLAAAISATMSLTFLIAVTISVSEAPVWLTSPAPVLTCAFDPEISALMRSEEHTSELQSLMRISYAVFCLKQKTYTNHTLQTTNLHAHIRELLLNLH